MKSNLLAQTRVLLLAALCVAFNMPDTPFAWSWANGVSDKSFFLATHTYADRTAIYTVTVMAHYPGNYTAKTVVAFQ